MEVLMVFFWLGVFIAVGLFIVNVVLGIVMVCLSLFAAGIAAFIDYIKSKVSKK